MGKSKKDKKVDKMAKTLWGKCPEKCSYSIDQTTHVSEKNCKADLDLKIRCVNKAKGGMLGNNKFKARMHHQVFQCKS